jgi:hypothetical protein
VTGPPVTIPVIAPPGSQAELTIYTLAFRKIYDQTVTMPVTYDFLWNLQDRSGKIVSNGIYYARVQVTGHTFATHVYKILVLR